MICPNCESELVPIVYLNDKPTKWICKCIEYRNRNFGDIRLHECSITWGLIMKLEVIRRKAWSDDKATEGELFINGEFAGYTLEPPVLDPPTKPRAIPTGTYNLTWAFSPKHQCFLPLVENVPDFVGIEIHIGNYPKDTEACLLVGEVRGKDMVQKSTSAIQEVWRRVKDAFDNDLEMTITYTAA